MYLMLVSLARFLAFVPLAAAEPATELAAAAVAAAVVAAATELAAVAEAAVAIAAATELAAAAVLSTFWTLMGELERREKEEVDRLGDNRRKGVGKSGKPAASTAADIER
jgi:hypothetical protein